MSDFVSDVAEAERQQTIKDLKAARTELVTRGRAVGALVDHSTGEVCAMGAVGVATINGFADRPTLSLLEHHPRAKRAWAALETFVPRGEYGTDVDAFNDHGPTTDEDVLNLFDKALADLGGLG